MISKEQNDFYDYVLSFYGKHGIIQYDAPHIVIKLICVAVSHRKDAEFDGDTMDRELVAEILQRLGYKPKENGIVINLDNIEVASKRQQPDAIKITDDEGNIHNFHKIPALVDFANTCSSMGWLPDGYTWEIFKGEE